MGETPRPTLERVWVAYLAAVAVVAVVTPGGGDPRHGPWSLLALHAALAAAAWWCARVATRRGPDAARPWRTALALIGLPASFSALRWLLPAVHPEPYEYDLLALDRWLFGGEAAQVLGPPPPLLAELLQLTYGAFYFLCIAAVVAAGVGGGRRAFDRAMLVTVGGFLVSYLGYLLVPVLGPNRVFEGPPPQGVWIAAPLHEAIDAAEANPWDCFPSGHTMMTLTALLVTWRPARRAFWLLLVPVASVIVSTVVLRYHWLGDVAAGAVLAWPCARFFGWLGDRDGWPDAVPAAPPAPQASLK
ncbi:MAG: phosphatase PAP2 family protein [Planctomycetes bacterium]|nr:phosphatase PAP2 family protein [Planctomycetota bacterium]